MEPFEKRKKKKPQNVLGMIACGIFILIIPKEDGENFMNYLAYGFILFGIIEALIPVKEKQVEREARERKTNYYNALNGSDKPEALKLGRLYYGGLRGDGKVTTYDEQAINNDLNSMTNTVNMLNTVIHKIENEELNMNNSIVNQKKSFCSYCGKPYTPNNDKIFCDSCGHKL